MINILSVGCVQVKSSKPVGEKLVERKKEGVHPGKVLCGVACLSNEQDWLGEKAPLALVDTAVLCCAVLWLRTEPPAALRCTVVRYAVAAGHAGGGWAAQRAAV